MKIFVPGRICLFGEHSDWAGGYRRTNADIEKGFAIIAGTNQGIYAEVDAHPNALVLSSTNTNRDGKWRDVTLKAVTPGIVLKSRGGYRAPAQ